MSQVLVERDGHLMIVMMNRPHTYNAMTPTMLSIMADAWKEASEDPGVRCVIVTGAGGNFSSGADLRVMGGEPDPDEHPEVTRRQEHDPDFVFRALLKTYRPTKPLIAAVEGVAVAGGTELLQGTDIRVAAAGARFGVSEVRWSLYPMGGSAVRLPRQIPYTAAADILLTGRHIGATEAKSLGLVGHVVPDGEALARSREIADTICANGPLAVQAVLRTLHDVSGMPEPEAFAYEQPYASAVFESDDAREGPRAFVEKRRPEFHGR